MTLVSVIYVLYSVWEIFGTGDVHKIFLSGCTSRENLISDTPYFMHVVSDVCEILHIML
jgi:hypothetical protein